MFGPPMDDNRAQATAFVEQATNLPIINLAFNAAVSSCTPTEILSVVSFGQRPLAVLIMSPVLAKTLAISLLERVKEYERMSGVATKTIAEMIASNSGEIQ